MSGRRWANCWGVVAVMAGAAALAAGPIGIGPEPGTAPPDQPQIGINPVGPGAAAASPAPAAQEPAAPAEDSAILNTSTAKAPVSKWAVGDPVADMMSGIAVKFGAILVMPRTSAMVLKAGEVPKTLEEAVSVARDNLEPQGLGLIETVTDKPDPRVVLRVTTLKAAREAEEEVGPVTSGESASVIDVKDPAQQVTHLMKVNNPDQLEMLEHKAREDASVAVDVAGSAEGGETLILRGPAAKVKQAVAAVAAMDKAPPDATPAVRQLKLTHVDAVGAAATLNAGFGGQGRGQIRAVADRRTNTVVITGPEEQVIEALVTLVEMDLDARGGVPAAGNAASGENSSGQSTTAPGGGAPGAGR